MTPLPQPEWGREGETWRVEPEDAVPWRTDVGPLYCRAAKHGMICRNRAVAGYTSRSMTFVPFCEQHLNQSNLWIENGRVVSWRLSK